MSRPLYGKVSGDGRSGVTKAASHEIESWVQTTKGRISVSLKADGSFRVWHNPVCSHVVAGCDTDIASGNVNELTAA
jgi:hypothetical protein